MEAKKSRPNFTQDVTDKLVALMEGEGLKPWEASWDQGITKAFNPYTRQQGKRGREYRGGNAMNLLMAQLKRKSTDPRWLSFNQVKEAGLSIKKGAHAEAVIYWKFPEDTPRSRAVAAARRALYDGGTEQDAVRAATDSLIESMDDDPSIQVSVEAPAAVEEAKARPQDDNRPKPLYSLVFNGADVVGMPPMKERRVFNANERAERLIQATGAVIQHSAWTKTADGRFMGNKAFYSRNGDTVVVPPRGHFKTPGDYYRTVLHEIAHWTGHESRLDRDLGKAKPNTPEYAWEELRAEIASAMICAALGVEGELADHASYLDHYVKLLKEDRGAIFKAARDAEKIYDMVMDFDPELRAEVESYLGDNALTKADPKAKKEQVFDLKKVIKGELPNFIPATVKTGGPSATPGGSAETPKPTGGGAVAEPPVDDADVEVDFGGLTVGAAAEAADSMDDDAEIVLDPAAIPDAEFDEFSSIEFGPQ